MSKTIIVKDILGNDIRTRNNAIALRSALNGSDCKEVDMTGIIFISRSFADELLNVKKDFGVEIVNASGEVLTMITIVDKGRRNVAPKTATDSKVIEMADMQDLTNYFATM